MSIDAVAVLRIAALPEPATPFGTNHPVEHRGDTSLVNLMQRFDGADPDEHALALRRLLGPALDAHDDPRGILFFADHWSPIAVAYEAIVSEASVRGGGVWTPKVDADYVPVRYRGKPRQPHDVVVGEMIAAMGRDAALQLDLMAQVNKLMLTSSPVQGDAAEEYRAKLAAITGTMGAEFARRYEASLEQVVKAARAAQAMPMSLGQSDEAPDEHHAPERYAQAPANSHDALVAEMIRVMGREAALQANMTASMGTIVTLASPDFPNAADPLRVQLDAIRGAMGDAFADRYEASLERQAEALRAQAEVAIADWQAPPDWLKKD